MKSIRQLLLLALLFQFFPAFVYAQHTIVLKNGRRITVQSYREDGNMIKFRGMGGEIGLSKDQVQTILKAGQPETQGMSVIGLERAAPTPAAPSPGEKRPAGPAPAADKPAEVKEKPFSPEEEKAKVEKEFQNKVGQLTEQIKALRDRYATSTRGSAGPEPTLLQTEEAIKARTDDLISRLRDAQHNPGGPSDAGGVRLSTPSGFAGVPPTTTELRPGELIPRVDVPLPGYTGREKELSDLRNQLNQLSREREALIEQMRQKNLDTGGLFLE